MTFLWFIVLSALCCASFSFIHFLRNARSWRCNKSDHVFTHILREMKLFMRERSIIIISMIKAGAIKGKFHKFFSMNINVLIFFCFKTLLRTNLQHVSCISDSINIEQLPFIHAVTFDLICYLNLSISLQQLENRGQQILE